MIDILERECQWVNDWSMLQQSMFACSAELLAATIVVECPVDLMMHYSMPMIEWLVHWSQKCNETMILDSPAPLCVTGWMNRWLCLMPLAECWARRDSFILTQWSIEWLKSTNWNEDRIDSTEWLGLEVSASRAAQQLPATVGLNNNRRQCAGTGP
jgi:hypothetical protein